MPPAYVMVNYTIGPGIALSGGMLQNATTATGCSPGTVVTVFELPSRGFFDRQSIDMDQRALLQAALDEAQLGLRQGGLPIGSILADSYGRILARGHNLRVQTGDPTAHAEVVCIRNAGRRRDWSQLTLVSTLSPCVMCTGTTLLYRIPRVIVGENQNFMGAEDLFRQRGVDLKVVQDPACIQMMSDFIRDHADLWNEDIGR